MNDDDTNRDAPASSGGAQCSADDLRVIVDSDGDLQIWWEDMMILGSGQTLDEARLDVVNTVASIMKQLPHLSPPNDKLSD